MVPILQNKIAVVVVVVVFTLKTVLTSIQYLLFVTLQGKETNFRGHKLTHCCCCCLHIKNRSDLYPVPSLCYSSRQRNKFPWSQANPK